MPPDPERQPLLGHTLPTVDRTALQPVLDLIPELEPNFSYHPVLNFFLTKTHAERASALQETNKVLAYARRKVPSSSTNKLKLLTAISFIGCLLATIVVGIKYLDSHDPATKHKLSIAFSNLLADTFGVPAFLWCIEVYCVNHYREQLDNFFADLGLIDHPGNLAITQEHMARLTWLTETFANIQTVLSYLVRTQLPVIGRDSPLSSPRGPAPSRAVLSIQSEEDETLIPGAGG